jgi:hypothetical protein
MGAESLAFLAALWVKPKKTVLSVGYWHPLYKIKETLQHLRVKAQEDC